MPTPALSRTPKTALIVDDDQDMCSILDVALTGLGCAVKTVGTAQMAISSMADCAFQVAFVDARLPDMDGLRLVGQLRGLQPAMRIIVISGYYLEDDARILEAMHASEIDGFVAKPFQIHAIMTAAMGNNGGALRP